MKMRESEIKLTGESINTLGYEVRESDAQNRDEKCRTMKGRMSGVLEELTDKTKLRPFEKSCSETAMSKSEESKQLDQTEVLVKHARFH